MVKGYSQREKKNISCVQLFRFYQYNQSMGGVDLLDRFISQYRPTIQVKKWYWQLFVNYIETLTAAVWRLHVTLQTSPRSPVTLQLRAPPKVSARAPAHRSYHFRGVKLKSCIKKIHHNLYISKQANVRIKHADTEGASHKKFGTDARVQ